MTVLFDEEIRHAGDGRRHRLRRQTARHPSIAVVERPMDEDTVEVSDMRSRIEIVQIRAAEVEPGDVVNKRGPNRDGWIEVESLEELESGQYVVHDESGRESFTAAGYDLVWLQLARPLRHNSHIPLPD